MKKLVAIYSVIMFCFASMVLAQDKAEISLEKRKLIAEIISVTEADKQAEDSAKEYMQEMNKLYPSIVESVVDGSDKLNDSEKASLKKEMLGKRQSFDKRFQEKLIEKISYKDLIEITIYPTYDKLFTEEELQDLLTFYKTSTGKKLIKVSPQIGIEILNKTTQYLLPKIMGTMSEMTKEGF